MYALLAFKICQMWKITKRISLALSSLDRNSFNSSLLGWMWISMESITKSENNTCLRAMWVCVTVSCYVITCRIISIRWWVKMISMLICRNANDLDFMIVFMRCFIISSDFSCIYRTILWYSNRLYDVSSGYSMLQYVLYVVFV